MVLSKLLTHSGLHGDRGPRRRLGAGTGADGAARPRPGRPADAGGRRVRVRPPAPARGRAARRTPVIFITAAYLPAEVLPAGRVVRGLARPGQAGARSRRSSGRQGGARRRPAEDPRRGQGARLPARTARAALADALEEPPDRDPLAGGISRGRVAMPGRRNEIRRATRRAARGSASRSPPGVSQDRRRGRKRMACTVAERRSCRRPG